VLSTNNNSSAPLYPQGQLQNDVDNLSSGHAGRLQGCHDPNSNFVAGRSSIHVLKGPGRAFAHMNQVLYA